MNVERKTLFMSFLVITIFAWIVFVPRFLSAEDTSQDSTAKLFKLNCAICHGADGSGNTPMGKKLNVKDLRSEEVQKLSDAELTKIIAKGKGKMPAFDKKLKEEEINKLVAFIRELAKKK